MDIISYEKMEHEVMTTYKTGGGVTFYAGYKGLAKHYSVKEGGVTDWTGYAGNGKTELLLDVVKNCNEWYNHKYLIHMPDAGTIGEVVGKIMHKMSCKQFEEFYYNDAGEKVIIDNRLSEEDIKRLLPIVYNAFKIFDPKTKNNSKAITPKEYWKFAVENKKELDIFGAIIDSWNYMRHDMEGFAREDKWLEDTLSFRNELAERSNMHFHTVIHPVKARTNKEGSIIPPDMHSLKGGSEWGNNGKTIIVVDRDFISNVTNVIIVKAKPKIVGVRGACRLFYDVKTGGYYEFIEGNRREAEPLKSDHGTELIF